MKAYKFINSKFFKKRTFRLGTLWDYRREELYGSTIGDKGEGVYQIEFSRPFVIDNDFQKRIFENQLFSAAYVKGDRDENEGKKHFVSLAAPNIHIFSASLVYDKKLFQDFEGTNLCLEIPEFEKFSRLLVNQIKKKHTVEKWAIYRCVYMDRKVFDSPESVPSLPSIKEPKHSHQEEIRLCVSIIKPCHITRSMVTLDEPIIVPGKKALKQCKVYKRM